MEVRSREERCIRNISQTFVVLFNELHDESSLVFHYVGELTSNLLATLVMRFERSVTQVPDLIISQGASIINSYITN